MKVAWRSDIGRKRASNQDACLVLDGAYPLYAVADGMGGHLGGDIASAMAVQGLRACLEGQLPGEERIRLCYDQISGDIYRKQMEDAGLSGMGTTLTMLWEAPDMVYLGHVGDSRAYLLRDGELRQVTSDHSLVSELLRTGAIDTQSARDYPYRNVITRAVGTDRLVESDTHILEKLQGDRWLLCSDGLSEYFTQEELMRALQGDDMEAVADRLVQTALQAGGRDNITLILLEAAP